MVEKVESCLEVERTIDRTRGILIFQKSTVCNERDERKNGNFTASKFLTFSFFKDRCRLVLQTSTDLAILTGALKKTPRDMIHFNGHQPLRKFYYPTRMLCSKLYLIRRKQRNCDIPMSCIIWPLFQSVLYG